MTYIFNIICFFILSFTPVVVHSSNLNFIDQQILKHKNISGISVLDKGEQALLARAWLADNAQHTIDVQYFIWSTDNIGILASESLLRAADRGVLIRVIVDDLLIDAADKNLLALASHPNVDIKIYNPLHSVGTSFLKRLFNLVAHFRDANQRMHDKTFIVDHKVAITGGRNMADEYFDFNQSYNFRDRDVLVIGKVVEQINNNFERFWDNELSESIQNRFADNSLLKVYGDVNNANVQKVFTELHQYANSTDNFELNIRTAIKNLSVGFKQLIDDMVWTKAVFISDLPGKNDTNTLKGGGLSSDVLASLIKNAKKKIIIQSPYLVLSDEAEMLFKNAIKRGVKIKISTNSLLSTDNLQAFSGYKNQRSDIITMGIEVFEYKPFPEIQKQLLKKYSTLKKQIPIFAIHAKTMVIDSKIVFIGTYNLDPRSQNLNTEVGIIAHHAELAKSVENLIYTDMRPENSWVTSDNADQYAPWQKRLKVFFWQLMPIHALL